MRGCPCSRTPAIPPKQHSPVADANEVARTLSGSRSCELGAEEVGSALAAEAGESGESNEEEVSMLPIMRHISWDA
jgi:hypothetical protein